MWWRSCPPHPTSAWLISGWSMVNCFRSLRSFYSPSWNWRERESPLLTTTDLWGSHYEPDTRYRLVWKYFQRRQYKPVWVRGLSEGSLCWGWEKQETGEMSWDHWRDNPPDHSSRIFFHLLDLCYDSLLWVKKEINLFNLIYNVKCFILATYSCVSLKVKHSLQYDWIYIDQNTT